MPRPGHFAPVRPKNRSLDRLIPRLWRVCERILANLEDDVAGRPRGSRRFPRRLRD
jgi:hypothetical protein